MAYRVRLIEYTDLMRENAGQNRWWAQLLQKGTTGLLIGLACIMPGVSGGVMAVSFGVYQPVLESVTNFFVTPRKSIAFLLPYLLGVAVGIFLGAMVLSHVLSRFYVQAVCLFAGLVMGGVPSFLREANSTGFQARYLVALLGGAALASCMMLLDTGVSSQSVRAVEALLWWQAVLTGGIVAFGTIIPGISMSFILMILGWYEPMLAAIARLCVPTVICIALGALPVAIACMQVMVRLFRKYSGYTHYGVLGFLSISMILAFPDLPGYPDVLPCLLLIAGGTIASYLLLMQSDHTNLDRIK